MIIGASKGKAAAPVRRAFISMAGAALLVLGLNAGGGLPGLAGTAHAEQRVQLSSSQASQRIKLGLNKSIVIDLPQDAYDILVANPAVADAVTRTARRIYLFGKTVGETNIFVFGSNGEQIASLDLQVERDVSGLSAYLRRHLPHSDIQIELINDNVVLTGTVQTPLDARRAVQLAEIFVSGGEATTGQYSQTAAGGDASAGVSINNPDRQRRSSGIVNMLNIVGDDQVTLKVTVAEVSRRVMRQLGVDLVGSGSVDGISWGALSNLGNPANPRLDVGGSVLSGYISAMEQAGVMRTLAEPNLSAVSGEKATFRAGGEFNFPVGGGLGEPPSIETIEYGIDLEFQPVVLSPGRISLKVRTAVSEPITEGMDQAGLVMPSVRRRLADTTIELPSGGTMMIAGLVNDSVRQTYDQVPGLSKVPILGTLFRSRQFEREETELIVLVTPYLAQPAARNEFARPDDNFNPASEGAGAFLGKVNRVFGTMKRDRPDGRYHGAVGFIYK